MSVATAIELGIELLNTATNALAQLSAVSAIIQKANAENRTELTAAEWAVIDASNQLAKQALLAAIQTALDKAAPVVSRVDVAK